MDANFGLPGSNMMRLTVEKSSEAWDCRNCFAEFGRADLDLLFGEDLACEVRE